MDNDDVIISGRSVIKTMEECEPHKDILVKPNLWRKMGTLCKMTAVAARLALKEAGIEDRDIPRDRTAVILATTHGPTESKLLFIQDAYKYGLHLASPFVFPNTVMNMPAGMVSIETGARGTNCMFVMDSGHLKAVTDYSAQLIREKMAELVICGSAHEPKGLTEIIDDVNCGVEIIIMESRSRASARGRK